MKRIPRRIFQEELNNLPVHSIGPSSEHPSLNSFRGKPRGIEPGEIELIDTSPLRS